MTRYKTREFQRLYETMIAAAADRSSELYLPSGEPHRGAAHRCCFWSGFEGGKRPLWVVPGTLGMVCYQAGRAAARERS